MRISSSRYPPEVSGKPVMDADEADAWREAGPGPGVAGLDEGIVVLVGLACVASALSDMAKMTLSVSAIAMSEQFGWANADVGRVQSALFVGFLLMQLPGGALSKQFTGKRVLKYAVLIWSAGTALTPVSASLGLLPLCAARTLVGLGQGLAPTALTDVLARHVPATYRARCAGAVFTGFSAGSVVSLLGTPVVLDSAGWEPTFYGIGALGLAWAVCWNAAGEVEELPLGSEKAFQKKVDEDLDVGMVGIDIVSSGSGPQPSVGEILGKENIPWRSFFASSAVWAVVAGHFSDNWGKFALTTWLPTYFHSELGMNTDQAGLWTTIPLLLGIGVAAFSSPTSDNLINQGWSVTTVRKLMMGAALFGPAFFLSLTSLAGSGSDESPLLVLAAITCAMGVSRFSVSSLYCIHQDMSPQYASTLLGITNTFGALAGVISAYATGAAKDASGSWQYSLFLPAIAVYVLGGIAWIAYADARGQNFSKASRGR